MPLEETLETYRYFISEVDKLKLAYIVKGTIAAILILLAIAFAVALYQSNNTGGT